MESTSATTQSWATAQGVPTLPAKIPEPMSNDCRVQAAAVQAPEQPSKEAAPEQFSLQASAEQPATSEQPLNVLSEAEQTAPATCSSGPYLASTQTCALDVQMLENGVETSSCELRSLRQLEHGMEEAVFKEEDKAALSEVCSVVLSPKITERQLPMHGEDEDDDADEDDDEDEGDDEDEDEDEDDLSDDQAEYEGQENALVAAMSGLKVTTPKTNAPVPLRGLPVPQGRHIRFNDEVGASESPKRTVLRGLPVATGTYKRFD